MIVLRPHQAVAHDALLDAPTGFHSVHWARRTGKTYFGAYVMAIAAVTKENGCFIVESGTDSHRRAFLDHFLPMVLELNKNDRTSWTNHKNHVDIGSSTVYFPGPLRTPDAFRGMNVDGMILDEVEPAAAERLMRGVRGWVLEIVG